MSSNNLPLNKNFINGQWLTPFSKQPFAVIQPATEDVVATLIMSNTDDVDLAVKAASSAFSSFQKLTKEARLSLFDNIIAKYEARYDEMVIAVSTEMGAPPRLSRDMQVAVGLNLLKAARSVLADYQFEHQYEGYIERKEPIGVCGMITPWNWPLNQMVAKVAAALAAGCSMILKPSEYAPISAALFTDILAEAGVPDGVFNLIQGGAEAGAHLAQHPCVDMISITGSTRAGIAVAQAAAPTVKRVTQELGGKSPYIILPDSDIAAGVASCIRRLMVNNGQSCNAPTRLLVPANSKQQVEQEIIAEIGRYKIGDSFDETADIGPLVNAQQYQKVTQLIASGISDGAVLLTGGEGKPEGMNKGYFVKPTVFTNVSEDMNIVTEEIFGPVLCVITYENEQEALIKANNTPYGLTAYVYGKDAQEAIEFSSGLRVGMVHINDANADLKGPFGGFKMSGNGRERGVMGLEEYLETKAIFR